MRVRPEPEEEVYDAGGVKEGGKASKPDRSCGCCNWRRRKQDTVLSWRSTRLMIANDNLLRWKMFFPTLFFYADLISDCRQLVLFFKTKHYTYFILNLCGVILAIVIDFVKAQMDRRIEQDDTDTAALRRLKSGIPIIGPSVSMLTALVLRERVPESATRDDLNASATRLRRLQQECRFIERTAFFESVVEGATSLAVQGFALAYESDFTTWERFSLSFSICVTTITMSLVLVELDSKDRTMETVVVKVPREAEQDDHLHTEPSDWEETGSHHLDDANSAVEAMREVAVPLICGTLRFPERYILAPFRWVEIVGRMSTIIMFAVAVKQRIGLNSSIDAEAWLHTAIAIMSLAIMDFSLAVATMPPKIKLGMVLHRATTHTFTNFVAHGSPLMYPATWHIAGPSKVYFYAMRAVQNLLLCAATLAYFGHFDGSRTRRQSDNQSYLTSLACGAALLTTLAAPLALWLCPHKIPDKTRKGFFSLLGISGQAFPQVDDDIQRATLQMFGLLPIHSGQEEDEEALNAEKDGQLEDPEPAGCQTGPNELAVLDRWRVQELDSPLFRDEERRVVSCEGTFKALEVLSSSERANLVELVLIRLREEHVREALPTPERANPPRLQVLKELQKLRCVRIKETRWEPKVWQDLGEYVFPEWRCLETLELGGSSVEKQDTLVPTNFRSVAQSIPALWNLRQLSITRCQRVTSAGWRYFVANVVPQLRHLKELDLTESLSDASLLALGSEFVAHLPAGFEHLDLDSMGLSRCMRKVHAGVPVSCMSEVMNTYYVEGLLRDVNDGALEASLAGLRALPALSHFSAGVKNFTDENWGILMKELLPMYNLQELDIRGNPRISSEKWAVLADLVLPCYPSLASLDISACALNDDKIVAAQSGLKTLVKLKKLRLASNAKESHEEGITSRGWACLAKIFPCYRELVELDISDTSLNDEGIAEVGEGLCAFTALDNLKMAGNDGISAAGWMQVSRSFACLNNLSQLDISRCGLDGPNIESVASGVGKLSNLRILNVSYNKRHQSQVPRQATMAGFGRLRAELEQLPGLTLVDSRMNHRVAIEALIPLRSEMCKVLT